MKYREFELSGVDYEEVLGQGDSVLGVDYEECIRARGFYFSLKYREFELSGGSSYPGDRDFTAETNSVCH